MPHAPTHRRSGHVCVWMTHNSRHTDRNAKNHMATTKDDLYARMRANLADTDETATNFVGHLFRVATHDELRSLELQPAAGGFGITFIDVQNQFWMVHATLGWVAEPATHLDDVLRLLNERNSHRRSADGSTWAVNVADGHRIMYRMEHVYDANSAPSADTVNHYLCCAVTEIDATKRALEAANVTVLTAPPTKRKRPRDVLVDAPETGGDNGETREHFDHAPSQYSHINPLPKYRAPGALYSVVQTMW